MSLTAKPPAPPETAAPPEPGRPRVRPAALWARVALAAAVLAASGAVRAWQGQRFDRTLREGRLPPFPLNELPLSVGTWEGSVQTLDPAIARATGSTDHTFRSYVDTRTGVRIDAIILYGPASEVFIHAPDNCYPAQGYACAEGPDTRLIRVGGEAIPFHAAVYAKGRGGQVSREEVYHSWYYGGRWTPGLPVAKQAERIPGMLKVHLSRPVLEGEHRYPEGRRDEGDFTNPCEDFLARLLPEIQRRLEGKAAPAAAGPASTPPPPTAGR